MSKSDKLKGLAEEMVGFVNAMHGHFAVDLEGASIATCISYGECVGMLHNAANMLGRDVARLSEEEAAAYRPGVMLTHGGWTELKKLHDGLRGGALLPQDVIVERLHAIIRTGLPWVGGDPT